MHRQKWESCFKSNVRSPSRRLFSEHRGRVIARRAVRKWGTWLLVVFLLLLPGALDAGDFTRDERQILTRLARERDVAARRYVRLWLKGAPAQERAQAAISVLAAEAHIGAMCFGEAEEMENYSLLWGRNVDEGRLGIVLLERLYNVDLDVYPILGKEEQE